MINNNYNSLKDLKQPQVEYINRITGYTISRDSLIHMKTCGQSHMLLHVLEPLQPFDFGNFDYLENPNIKRYSYSIEEIPFHDDWIVNIRRDTDLDRHETHTCFQALSYYVSNGVENNTNVSLLMNKLQDEMKRREMLRMNRR